MGNIINIKWLDQPEEHNYPATESFLSLIYDGDTVAKLVKELKEAPISSFKAKDIFRASGLSLLGVSNSHVEKDRKKIEKGTSLSPILLVRESAHRKIIVADGYHRMCAVYSLNEDSAIPCKIV